MEVKNLRLYFWFSLSLQKHCNIASILPIEILSYVFSRTYEVSADVNILVFIICGKIITDLVT